MSSLPLHQQRPIRVAVADDEPSVRLLLRTMLDLVPNVDVVGVAANGLEAVQVVERERPDVVLLDVNMPRLDGPGAAELIGAFRPRTRTILHSASPQGPAQAHARELGMTVVDKADFERIVHEVLAHDDLSVDDSALREIESVVMTAMEDAGREAAVIARPDGTVPFYNARSARALGLPYPDRETDLAGLRRNYETCYPDGRPMPFEERPICRALIERQPIELRFALRTADGLVVYRSRATPFFDDHGELLGAAHYFSRAGSV